MPLNSAATDLHIRWRTARTQLWIKRLRVRACNAVRGWHSTLAAAGSLRPRLDLMPQPELAATATHVDDRSRHLRIPALVATDAVELCESEDLSDGVRVNELIHVDSAAHDKTISLDSREVDGLVL